MGNYTKEMHEAYRKEQDEKAAQEDRTRERTEKESARRAWLADGGKEATSSASGRAFAMRDAAGVSWTQTAGPAKRCVFTARAAFRRGSIVTARTIIEAERHENLEAFEETFARLKGVTEEHVRTLSRASTTALRGSRYPQSDDPLAQAAYTAAALRGLAEAVAALQCRKTRRRRSQQGKRANQLRLWWECPSRKAGEEQLPAPLSLPPPHIRIKHELRGRREV